MSSYYMGEIESNVGEPNKYIYIFLNYYKINYIYVYI